MRVRLNHWLFLLLTSLLAWSVFASESDKTDWPQWRGKNQDGKSSQTGVFKFHQGYGLKVAWKKPLGSGYSSISVVGDHAVTMFSDSTNDYLISLNPDNGSENWRYRIDETYDAPPNSYDGPLSTPVIDRDKVFALGAKGHLFAVDLNTGRELWKHHIVDEYNARQPHFGFTTAPHVNGDVLIVETGGSETNTVSGFDVDSGKLLWATGTDQVNYQSPISSYVFGENHLLCVGDKYVYGLNPKSGDMLWEYHHDGGAGSINPVVIGKNKFLINYKNTEAVLFEVTRAADKFAVQEVWKTRGLKRSFSNSVHMDGYIYGYDARFITCVDANTGETVWKSRPPGDGFLIAVDNHLVVMTKRGTLHVSKASPEGYNELAGLEVFDKLTWTPVSFANGKIFARNFHEIAAIDIAKVEQAKLATPEVEQLHPRGAFAKFVKRVEEAPASQKKGLVETFTGQHSNSPIIEGDKFAHIYYYGASKDVALLGDMVNSGQEVPMHQIAGTNFYYRSFELESDAHLNYVFRHDFDNVILDPRNKLKVASFTTGINEASELLMPGWTRPSHLNEAAGAKGKIETFEFESKLLDNKRNVHVYLPAGYSSGQNRFSAVYVNYGNFAKDMGLMPNTLDNLISANEIQPVIAVFVEAPNSFQEYARQQRDKHAQMFVEELIPHIDGKYRTIASGDNRLFMGVDEGGYAAIYAAFKYPGTASMLAGQSTHFFPNAGGNEITELVQKSDKQEIRFYLDWATYGQRGNNFHWKDFNMNFVRVLEDKGYKVVSKQVNEGFGWSSWRNRTDVILKMYFPANS